MLKVCKLFVFFLIVKCLINMGFYSFLVDDVYCIISVWGYDIKLVFDDFRCWISCLNNRFGWFLWVIGSLFIL